MERTPKSLWDAREINRRFRDSMEGAKGAQILFTHFGPGWAEAFFGIAGDVPLIGAEAKFERHLRGGIRFHHRHALIGRNGLIENLDAFVGDAHARVFITGRGGLGKSRLLLQWSRNFNHRHPGHTLRFLSDKCADFGPALQVAPQPLTLVFDDAHRLDDVRRALFHELLRREAIKLVLALRPGPIGQVTQELLGAGFDSTEIITAEPIKSLTSKEAMELVDAALKPAFRQHRHFLLRASRDSPLIAVVGAELINTGALASGDLLDEAELQRRVFEGLLDDARSVRETFGTGATDDFLRLLALLGPVKLDSAFFAKASPFLGMQHAHHVSSLRDALDSVGLLHTTGAGRASLPTYSPTISLTPPVTITLARAAPSPNGCWNIFLPVISRSSCSTSQRPNGALSTSSPNAASVAEPLWKWFCERFEQSPFHERREQIHEWANIAYLQPERSLALVELALSLTNAPETEHPSLRQHGWDTHEHSLEWLPKDARRCRGASSGKAPGTASLRDRILAL